jgi:signal transduction histidine kinase
MRYEIEDWRGYVYLAVGFALYAPAVALAPSASFALFVLCPHAFMVLRTVPAVGAVLLFNAVHVGFLYLRIGNVPDFHGVLLTTALITVSVAVIGIWSRHMVVEGERRAVLISELNASRGEIARLSHQTGITAERQRLAGEIHDTIAQGLSSVVMLIQAAAAELTRDDRLARETGVARRHLGLAAATARENIADARALVSALTPAELTGSPLAQALRRLADRFRAESGTPVALATADPERPLPTSIEVVLLRVAQESLANVRKHAAAQRVWLRLENRPDAVVLEIRDDGCGFTAPTGDGYGLAGMRARIDQVAGTLTVTTAPGAGTTVRAEVPVT